MRSIHPVIFSRIGKPRKGKGFSRGELRLAGLTAWIAQRIGFPVDLRRSTIHNENVAVLKGLLEERHAELEEKKQARKAKKEARVEAKVKRELERAELAKKEEPVIVEEVAPIEAIPVEEPELVEEEVVQVEETLTSLSNLEEMTSDEIKALNSQEIEYAEDLLGLSFEDMEDIVTASGIGRERLETFIFQAIDKLEQPVALNEVPGIGEKTAEQLKHVGIHSANKLARMNPNIEVKGISKARLKTFIEKAWELILSS